MSETTTTETELSLDSAAKRALIEAELRADASRSDREIARVVDVDHKTVGRARSNLRPTLAPPIAPLNKVSPPSGVVDEPEDHFEPEGPNLVIPYQPAIAIYWNRYHQIVIRQEASGYADEDEFILIGPMFIETLIARLRQVAQEASE